MGPGIDASFKTCSVNLCTQMFRFSSEPKQALNVPTNMKSLLLLAAFLFQQTAYGQKPVTISFTNDYKDVYHLSLVIYTPDGKGQTRVGDLNPGQTKTYTFPAGTEIFVADWKQEAFAMKGNDIKATGIKPTIILADTTKKLTVILSTLTQMKNANKPTLQ
jgi:hypothetical protein